MLQQQKRILLTFLYKLEEKQIKFRLIKISQIILGILILLFLVLNME